MIEQPKTVRTSTKVTTVSAFAWCIFTFSYLAMMVPFGRKTQATNTVSSVGPVDLWHRCQRWPLSQYYCRRLNVVKEDFWSDRCPGSSCNVFAMAEVANGWTAAAVTEPEWGDSFWRKSHIWKVQVCHSSLNSEFHRFQHQQRSVSSGLWELMVVMSVFRTCPTPRVCLSLDNGQSDWLWNLRHNLNALYWFCWGRPFGVLRTALQLDPMLIFNFEHNLLCSLWSRCFVQLY